MRDYKFFIGLLLVFLTPLNLFAQQEGGIPQVVKDDINNINGASPSGLSGNSFDAEELDDFYSMRHKRSGQKDFQEESQGQGGNPNQGETFSKDINVPLNFKDSVSGFGDTMKSQAYADMHADLLNSPNAVQDITWQLTEPGIAAGFASASQRAALQLGTRFQAEESLYRQFEANPEWGPQLARTYFSCVSRMMEQTGGQNQDQSAWLRAQAQCVGDSYTPQNGGQGGQQGNQSTFGQEPMTFDMTHDPDFDEQGNQGGNGEETIVFLSDRLFGKKPQGGAPPSQQNTEGDPEEYRKAFIDFIGDAQITMKAEQGGNTTNKRKKLIVLKRMRPEETGDIQKSTPEIHEEEASAVYKTLKEVLIGVCQAKLQQGAFQNSGADSEEKAFFEDDFQAANPVSYIRAIEEQCTPAGAPQGPQPNGSNDPCQQGGTAQDAICCKIKRINTPGFRWKILDFDYILNGLMPKIDEQDDSSCESLFGDSQQFANNNAGAPNDVRLSSLLMNFMARKVAKARLLLAYLKMEEVVLKTSSGTLSDPIRRTALNMVYENAASKGDLAGDYDRNIMLLRRGLAVLPQVMARMTSQSGKGISNAYSSYTSLMNSVGNNMRTQ